MLYSVYGHQDILWFFVQMLLSLQHVHSKQILHRDLKTQNILLDRKKKAVKVGDFGISKVLLSKSKAYTVIFHSHMILVMMMMVMILMSQLKFMSALVRRVLLLYRCHLSLVEGKSSMLLYTMWEVDLAS